MIVIILIVFCRDNLNENNNNDVIEFDTEKFIPIAVECFTIMLKINDVIEVSIFFFNKIIVLSYMFN